MPLIEVLPNSATAHIHPGWAYVPDTGYDPSKVAIQPSSSRHRAARNAPAAGGGVGAARAAERTARQNNAILKRLADLDRDNHRDVQIPVPARKDGGARASRQKVTGAVRKILTSQKTFANHLADEEAALALAGGSNQTQTSAGQATSAAPAAGARAKRASMSTAGPRGEQPGGDPRSGTSGPDDEKDPLLKSRVPAPPPQQVLDDLLAAPPLSYAAARAPPSSAGLPQRQFCEICGYWARVRCLKCGARVCGLDCKGFHDDGRCLKFYS